MTTSTYLSWTKLILGDRGLLLVFGAAVMSAGGCSLHGVNLPDGGGDSGADTTKADASDARDSGGSGGTSGAGVPVGTGGAAGGTGSGGTPTTGSGGAAGAPPASTGGAGGVVPRGGAAGTASGGAPVSSGGVGGTASGGRGAAGASGNGGRGGSATGGAGTGGAATGGRGTGGAGTGGAATGGAGTGGAATGGAGTGGAGTGGAPAGGGSVYVVAHPDDDLLFANPHLEQDILAAKRVASVLVTSGDGDPNWMARESSLRSAYAAMASVADEWTCAAVTMAAKSIQRCTLNARPLVSLFYLRVRDGQVMTAVNGTTVGSAGTSTVTWTAAQIRDVIAAVLADAAPARVGTLDATFAYGTEHDDHIAVGLMTLEAARNGTNRQLVIYRGYTMFAPPFVTPAPPPEPANLTTAEFQEKVRIMTIYNNAPITGTEFEAWCARFYPIISVTGGPAVLHAASGGCLAATSNTDGSAVTVASTCTAGTAQNWTAAANSRLTGRSSRCLGLNGTSAVIETCTGGADQQWTLLNNGQLRGAGNTCLTRTASAVSAETCGADTSVLPSRPLASQRWTF